MAEKLKKKSAEAKKKLAERREKVAATSRVVGKRATGKFAGFIDFVREQGVVGLAVGLAIGLQATEFTKAIVASTIAPIIDLMIGEGGLSDLKWTVQIANHSGTFDLGLLIDAMLKFLAVAFVIYFVVKGLKLDKLDKKKEA